MNAVASVAMPRRHVLLLAACIVGLGVAALVMFAPHSDAAVTYISVISGGPLDRINLGQDLSCQVAHTPDAAFEFYPSSQPLADCGTFLLVDSGPTAKFYAPDINNHCMTGGSPCSTAATGIGAFTAYTYVSQVGPTGAGTAVNPYKVVTTVDAGPYAHIVQTDRYVVGLDYYTTTVNVTNFDSTTHDYRIWRAGDCYLQGTDTGYGWTDLPTPMPSVACAKNPMNSPAARVETWISHTTGNRIMEGKYTDVWAQIGTHGAFPNTCYCMGDAPCPNIPPWPASACTDMDNAAGLSWDCSAVPSGGMCAVTHDLLFSPGPPPNQPPTASMSIDATRKACDDSRVFFTGSYSDPDGSVLWTHWDFGDGTFSEDGSATHTYANAGTYTVSLTVMDNGGMSTTVVGSVTAWPDLNCCPTLNALNDRSVMEGQFFRFTPTVDNWESDDVMQYTLNPSPPAGATMDPTTGYFFWRTAVGDAGDYPMTLHVTDNADHSQDGPCADTRVFVLHVTARPATTPVVDTDLDGVDNSSDNCPAIPNHDQLDSDRDGIGDACQDATTSSSGGGNPNSPATPTANDRDGDSVPDAADNCPGIPNRNQVDADRDGFGDACDADLDGDGVAQIGPAGAFLDNCAFVPNPRQEDTGNTGIGDACRGGQAQQQATAVTAGQQGEVAHTFGAVSSSAPPIAVTIAIAVATIGLCAAGIVWAMRHKK